MPFASRRLVRNRRGGPNTLSGSRRRTSSRVTRPAPCASRLTVDVDAAAGKVQPWRDTRARRWRRSWGSRGCQSSRSSRRRTASVDDARAARRGASCAAPRAGVSTSLVFFVTRRGELVAAVPRDASARSTSTAGLWIAWPKRTSGVATRPVGEPGARDRARERSRRQQGRRDRRHVVGPAVRLPHRATARRSRCAAARRPRTARTRTGPRRRARSCACSVQRGPVLAEDRRGERRESPQPRPGRRAGGSGARRARGAATRPRPSPPARRRVRRRRPRSGRPPTISSSTSADEGLAALVVDRREVLERRRGRGRRIGAKNR